LTTTTFDEMKKLFILIGLVAITTTISYAQSTYISTNPDYQHLVERYEIKQGKLSEHLFTSMKPYSRRGIAAVADSAWKQPNLSVADKFNLLYLLNDNAEWADSLDNKSKKPFLKYFYQNKADLYSLDNQDINLHINPILYAGGGIENKLDDARHNGINQIFARGVEVRSIIAQRVGFYTSFTENQMNLPYYFRQRTAEADAVPQEGFWKTTDAAGVAKDKTTDFLTARGYFTFNIAKKIDVQFGHDRHFWGNGMRSLMLSDFSSPYLFLKINTQIGRFKYTNLFTQMTTEVLAANQEFPKKYANFHHLGINIGKNFNIGVFEGIVFGREDTLRRTNSYELGYLNPIILYRFVEQQFGSIDNAILGIDFKWNIKKHWQLYGQVMLDEFVLSEIRSGNGWWSNKQSVQVGMKYIDVFGIQNLDLQGEMNFVRPFTYGHENLYTSYTNYQTPLAHPLGANFTEIIGNLRYQPLPRLQLTAQVMYAKKGEDKDGKNYGGNPLLPSATRVQDYNNRTGQGAATTILFADFRASYQIRHNVFLEFRQLIRNTESELTKYNYNTTSTFFALRWNMAVRSDVF